MARPGDSPRPICCGAANPEPPAALYEVTRGARPLRPPRQPIADLVRQARRRAAQHAHAGVPDPLQDVAAFGPDPGALRMRVFLPPDLPAGAPLLVALHGCSQTAAGFDHGCGWSELAARHGFALLLPEQRRENNAGLCFNWFEPGDTARGRGEAESIRAMVAYLVARHGIDPERVCVTGLSAGGAMVAALLATHPDVFAAGAIFAGLPYGAATSVQEAFEAMGGGRTRDAARWAALARAAAPPGTTRWPRVAIWQGGADATVRPGNAAELVKQWAALHGLDPARPSEQAPLGPPRAGLRRAWQDGQGRTLLEVNTLPDLDHGVPINPGIGEDHVGRTMPYILDAGVPGPLRVLEFFGFAAAGAGAAAGARTRAAPPAMAPGGVIRVGADGVARAGERSERADASARPAGDGEGDATHPWAHPGETIRRALRAAGLLRD